MGLFDKLLKGTPTSQQSTVENISLQRLIPKMREWKTDTVYISTSCNCPVCKPYNKKYYSFYGWNKKYPKAPDFILQRKCPKCGCSIGVTMKM